jgi:hypothetical protein
MSAVESEVLQAATPRVRTEYQRDAAEPTIHLTLSVNQAIVIASLLAHVGSFNGEPLSETYELWSELDDVLQEITNGNQLLQTGPMFQAYDFLENEFKRAPVQISSHRILTAAERV